MKIRARVVPLAAIAVLCLAPAASAKPVSPEPSYTTEVGGDILATSAASLTVEYEDHSSTAIPFVSKPINARAASADFAGAATAPAAAAARRRAGGHDRRWAQRRRRLRHPRSVGEPARGRQPAGHDLRLLPLYALPPERPGRARLRAPGDAHCSLRIFGLPTPYDGCEIEGSYGHRWPDRFRSHSPVEVAFTARGRRFFADRAAARDLALFVRSRQVQRIRRLGGGALASALSGRYGGRIMRLGLVGAPLGAGRIGYAVRAGGASFVERSTTGRRFVVTVSHGRIVDENVNSLALAF
jgi:hypothetical protein